MINSTAAHAEDDPVVIVPDPGIAQHLAESLGGHITVHGHRLPIRVDPTTILLDAHGRLPVSELLGAAHRGDDDEAPSDGWTVYLTDVPRRVCQRPVVADLSTANRVALVSLPAVGGLLLRHRVRRVVRTVLAILMDARAADPPLAGVTGLAHRVRLGAAPRLVHCQDAPPDVRLMLGGIGGRMRLLIGMVRSNRPWRLVPHLSGATAAAAATAAFGVFYSSIWQMADSLSPWRLTLIMVLSAALMTGWLVVSNSLWDTRQQHDTPGETVLYNITTLITVSMGVLCMYAVLFSLTFAAAVTVIADTYLQARLGHPVAITDYLALTWLSASMGLVAGALGSSTDTEEAVRLATYSRRERERRQRRRENSDR